VVINFLSCQPGLGGSVFQQTNPEFFMRKSEPVQTFKPNRREFLKLGGLSSSFPIAR
jgi:hypothetical protein